MKRFSWRVSGRVQGVGFRYTARRQAAMLGLTGWVKNEPDGTVALEVQGDSEPIEDLREFLLKGPGHIKVDNIEESELDVVAGEADFDITY